MRMHKNQDLVVIFVKTLRKKGEEETPMSVYLEEGRVYIAEKVPVGNGSRIMYRIHLDEQTAEGSSIFVIGKKIDTEAVDFEIEEIEIKDALLMEMHPDDLEKIKELSNGTYVEYTPGKEVVEEEEEEEIIDNQPPLPFFDMNMSERAELMANGIDLDYVKFQLYEIREKSPELFISMVNLIGQVKQKC